MGEWEGGWKGGEGGRGLDRKLGQRGKASERRGWKDEVKIGAKKGKKGGREVGRLHSAQQEKE